MTEHLSTRSGARPAVAGAVPRLGGGWDLGRGPGVQSEHVEASCHLVSGTASQGAWLGPQDLAEHERGGGQ